MGGGRRPIGFRVEVVHAFTRRRRLLTLLALEEERLLARAVQHLERPERVATERRLYQERPVLGVPVERPRADLRPQTSYACLWIPKNSHEFL